MCVECHSSSDQGGRDSIEITCLTAPCTTSNQTSRRCFLLFAGFSLQNDLICHVCTLNAYFEGRHRTPVCVIS